MAKRRSAKTKQGDRVRSVRYHRGQFPPVKIDWSALVPLLGPASAALARYDGLLAAIPNATVLLSPLTTQEAVLSSRIEGTQATMGEVLEFKAGQKGFDEAKVADIHEVLNYRVAMNAAIDELQTLPLCGRVIKRAHGELMAGVRGHDKAPGKYRTLQNFIGTPGRPVEEARFVPIAPEDLAGGMSLLEKYLHSRQPDQLVQLAVMHAEFESLHPFLDGNGRVGRMLIPLFLYEKELLQSPNFYISDYLERNRQEYYDRLLAVSRDGDWTAWCTFFLQALMSQAKKNEAAVRQILDLYASMKERVVEATHSQFAIAAIDALFDEPVFMSTDFIHRSGIPKATGKRILRQLSENNVLQIVREGRGSLPTVYEFAELLEIAQSV